MAENFFLNVQKYEKKLIKILGELKEEYTKIEDAENKYINSFISEIQKMDKVATNEWKSSKTAINKYLTELKKAKKADNKYVTKTNEWFNQTKSLINDGSLSANRFLNKNNLLDNIKGSLSNVNISIEYSVGDSSAKINVSNINSDLNIDTSNIKEYKDLPKTVSFNNESNNIITPYGYIYIYDQFRIQKLENIKDTRTKFIDNLKEIYGIINTNKENYKNLEQEMKDNGIRGYETGKGKYRNGATYIEEAIEKGSIDIPNIDDKSKEKFKSFLVDFINDLQTKEITNKAIFTKYDGEHAESLFDLSDCKKFIQSEITTDFIGDITIPKPDGKTTKVSLAKNYKDLIEDNGEIPKETVTVKLDGNETKKEYYKIYKELAGGTLPKILTQ